MAVWGGYPQTVNYSTVNVAKGGGSENLLINPRGKVNQLSEAQGVVAAGKYFCDGWKAGAAGAEVYIDEDGFRLISGSIVQLVPNTIEAGRNLRSSMDVISGAPVMSINGGTDNEPNSAGEYIKFEISGDNSKFSRIVLAESVEMPFYQQLSDEIKPCLRFLQKLTTSMALCAVTQGDESTRYRRCSFRFECMHKIPAVSGLADNYSANITVQYISKTELTLSATAATINHASLQLPGLTLDARP
ncbi:hypothetical protein KW425_10305 [Vibrio fluvialis]|nr:hypothetical protein [Vibrio fluvialis]